MLAGVVELVLRLTIAEEKIELSVPISSARVCARACMCVFVPRFLCMCMCVFVCERSYVLIYVHTSLRLSLQRRTQL